MTRRQYLKRNTVLKTLCNSDRAEVYSILKERLVGTSGNFELCNWEPVLGTAKDPLVGTGLQVALSQDDVVGQ